MNTIKNGSYPQYDLFVIRDILTGNHNVPENLKSVAASLYIQFSEHERKVATSANPNQYRSELLGLLSQKVSIEQQFLSVMPLEYTVRH